MLLVIALAVNFILIFNKIKTYKEAQKNLDLIYQNLIAIKNLEEKISEKILEYKIYDYNELMQIFNDTKDKVSKIKQYTTDYSIEESLSKYEKLLNQIIILKEEIFKPDVGITSKYYTIDKKIKSNNFSPVLVNYFEELKKHTNVLITNKISKKEYQKIVTNLISEIENLTLNSAEVTKFLDYFVDYYNSALLHFDKLKTIGFDQNEGIISELTKNNLLLEQQLQSLEKNLESNNDQLTSQIKILITINIVLILSIIAIIYFVLNILLQKELKKIYNITENISKGQLFIPVESFYFKEFKNLHTKIQEIIINLKAKSEIIEKLTEKNYKLDFQPPSQDELGQQIKKLIEKLEKTEKETQQFREIEEHQKWAATGLAHIGAIMRQYPDNLEELSKAILKATLEYINAQQGAFYIYNAEKNILELTAAFSYGKQRSIKKEILPYEGILGTVIIEKRHYYLENLPENYIFFETGFGYGKPSCLFIVPLLFENQLYGVMEITSIDPIPEFKQNFLITLASEIASTILYVKINLKTKELLEQSNKQANELITNQKLFKKNQENLKSLLKMTEEQLEEKTNLLKEKEKIIKEKVDIIIQLEKDVVEKEEIIENLTNEFETIKGIYENQINELKRKIADLQKRLDNNK